MVGTEDMDLPPPGCTISVRTGRVAISAVAAGQVKESEMSARWLWYAVQVSKSHEMTSIGGEEMSVSWVETVPLGMSAIVVLVEGKPASQQVSVSPQVGR